MTESGTEICHLIAFRVIVLRVIETFVQDSLDETISLTKITAVINSNELIHFLRAQMKELTPAHIDALKTITIRDVILSITKVFQASQIQILENNDNFKIKLSRPQFQDLITNLYEDYKEEAIKQIKGDELNYKRLMNEVSLIEKGEMDNVIISEFKDKLVTQQKLQQHQQQQQQQQQPKQPIQTQVNPTPVQATAPLQVTKHNIPIITQNSSSKQSPIPASQATQQPSMVPENSQTQSKVAASPIKKEISIPSSPAKSSVPKDNNKPSTPKTPINIEDGDEDQNSKKRAKIASPSTPTVSPNKKLQYLSNPLIANISSYKYASTFLNPVNESSAPEYYSLIKEPRDLKTIKQMVKDGRIQNKLDLEKNILLMYSNAIMYNKTGTDIYNWAKEMQIETDKMMELLKDADIDAS